MTSTDFLWLGVFITVLFLMLIGTTVAIMWLGLRLGAWWERRDWDKHTKR